MTPAPGLRLGRYLLTRIVGRGGMAEIWEAFDDRLHRTVAVKVIAAQISRDPEFAERFQREARLAASLEHPHILPIYDFGIEDETAYLVMPLLRGGSLRDRLRGEVPLADAVGWLRDLAGALDHAHANGVLHRDVTPKNVLFDASGRLFLCDFGLAKSAESGSELTAAGVVIGTPQYMSPEQGSGKAVDARSDQYALGTIAYRMLAGRLPFVADSAIVLLQKTLSETPQRPSRVNRNLPEAVDDVFATALAKDPDLRYASCAELVGSLAAAIETAPAALSAQRFEDEDAPTITPATAHAMGPDEETRPVTPPTGTASRPRPVSGSRGSGAATPPTARGTPPRIAADEGTPTPTSWSPASRSMRAGLLALVGFAAVGLAVVAGLVVRKGSAFVASVRAGAPGPQPASPVPTLLPTAAPPLPTATPEELGLPTPPAPVPSSFPPEGQPTLPPLPRPTLPPAPRPTMPQPPRPTLPPPIPTAGFDEQPPAFVPPTRAPRSSPPAAEPRAAAPADHTYRVRQGVKVNVEPSQARVFLDGIYIGISDDWDGHGGGGLLTFERGSRHRLRFAYSGRRDLVVDVLTAPDGDDDVREIELELEKGSPSGPTGPEGKVRSPDYRTSGAIRLVVEPGDAELSLDGTSVGSAARYREEDLRLDGPFVHELVLTAPGHRPLTLRVLSSASVPAGKPVVVKEKLKKG